MADSTVAKQNTMAVQSPHSAPLSGEAYMQTYLNTCGSRDGYESTVDKFIRGDGSHPSLLRTPGASRSTAIILGNAFHKFLAGGRGCAESTPGFKAWEAPHEIPSEVVEHLDGGGLRITTPDGPILIGVSPNHAKHETAGILTVASDSAQIDNGVPTLSKFSMRDLSANQSVPFIKSLNSGGTYVVRLNDYTLRIFSDGEYMGDISAFDVFNHHIKAIEHNGSLLLKAWNAYQTEFLRKGYQLISAMNEARSTPEGNMLEVAYANREFMHYFRGIEAFRKLDAFQTIGSTKSWEAKLIQGQYAKISNSVGVNELVTMMLAKWDLPGHGGLSSEELFRYFDIVPQDGAGTLFDPFDHLSKVFKMEEQLSEVVEVILPDELPRGLWNGDFDDGLAVRTIINETIYTVGQAAAVAQGRARLKFEFNPKRNTLAIIDESVEVHGALDALKEKFERRGFHKYVYCRMEDGKVREMSISLSPGSGAEVLNADKFRGFIPEVELAEAIRGAFEGSFNGEWDALSKTEQDAAIRRVAGYNEALGIDDVNSMGMGILINAINPNPVPRIFIAPYSPTPAP
jgi:hypothetical protein